MNPRIHPVGRPDSRRRRQAGSRQAAAIALVPRTSLAWPGLPLLRRSRARRSGAGVVLSGVSAGAVCWFTGGTTDSFGLPLREVRDGLGFLPYSHSAHHDAEEQRRSAISRLIAAERLPECYATDNGAAVTFFGTEFHEAVSETAGARAWHLSRGDDGAVHEEPLPARLLPDPSICT